MEQYRTFEAMVDECDNDPAEGVEKSKWVVRIELNIEAMLDKAITMDDIHYALKNAYGDDVSCVYSDYNADKLIFRIRLNTLTQNKKRTSKVNPLDQGDEIYILKTFQDTLVNNIVLRGVKGLNAVTLRKVIDGLVEKDGSYEREESWVLDTVGTNLLGLLSLDYVDTKRSYTNDIQEVYRVLGIEAARQAIFNEIAEVIEADGVYINYHHLSLLCDRMTYNSKMVSIFRHGINNDNIGPIAKASFEETPEMFLKAARHGELDIMRGVSANVMCGQEGYFGTSSFQVMLDTDMVAEQEAAEEWNAINQDDDIANGFGDLEDPTDLCSTSVIAVPTNVGNIPEADFGDDDTGYDPGF